MPPTRPVNHTRLPHPAHRAGRAGKSIIHNTTHREAVALDEVVVLAHVVDVVVHTPAVSEATVGDLRGRPLAAAVAPMSRRTTHSEGEDRVLGHQPCPHRLPSSKMGFLRQ